MIIMETEKPQLDDRIDQFAGIARRIAYSAKSEISYDEPMTAEQLARLHRIEIGMVAKGLGLNIPEGRMEKYLESVYPNASGNALTPEAISAYEGRAINREELKLLLLDEFPEIKESKYAH